MADRSTLCTLLFISKGKSHSFVIIVTLRYRISSEHTWARYLQRNRLASCRKRNQPPPAVMAGASRLPADQFMHSSIDRRTERTNVLLNLFVYSAAMFTLPFVAFYGAVHVAEQHFAVKDSGYLWGTAAAVITVHVLIAMFVWGAYKEVRDAEIATAPREITRDELNSRQKQD